MLTGFHNVFCAVPYKKVSWRLSVGKSGSHLLRNKFKSNEALVLALCNTEKEINLSYFATQPLKYLYKQYPEQLHLLIKK
jgi:hypothetical protein